MVRGHHVHPGDDRLSYLVAIMDWASRHVLSWRLSNTMDSSFCVEALEAADGDARHFNTARSLRAHQTVSRLRARGARWTAAVGAWILSSSTTTRSLKYEATELADGFVAEQVISEWMTYSDVRPHSALGGRTPAEAYRDRGRREHAHYGADRGSRRRAWEARPTTRGVIYQPGSTLTKFGTFPENRTTSVSRSLTGSSTVPFHRGGRCFVRLPVSRSLTGSSTFQFIEKEEAVSA